MSLDRIPTKPIAAVGLLGILLLAPGGGRGVSGTAGPSIPVVPVAAAPAAHLPGQPLAEPLAQLPATFIENRGQLDPAARFVVRQGARSTFLTPDRFIVQALAQDAARGTDAVRGVNVFFTFEGADPQATAQGLTQLPGHFNYFAGSDANQWITDVPSWSAVRLVGTYPGVDVDFRDSAGQVEYDLLVARGVDPSTIVVRCDGANGLSIDESGALVAQTALGALRQECPITWRVNAAGARERIDCRFRLIDDRHYGFDVPNHDANADLVIDPVIQFTGYLTGASYELARAVAIDPSGNLFVTGRTASTNYPRTPGCFDSTLNNTEAFVSKISANGSQLVYSTFLGSPGADQAFAIAVDSQGRAVVTGQAGTGFPTTTGAYDTSQNGWSDTFVTRLNPTGNGLVFSTYVGGSNDDYPGAIALDGSDNVYLAGSTKSTNFPTTAGAYDTTANGDWDGFVVKLSAAGNQLLVGTRLGGAAIDNISGLRLTSTGQIVVCGGTTSTDFPATAGAYDSTFNGGADGFVSKLAANGATLVWSTFLGGAGNDQALALALDASDDPVVTGQGYTGYPTTAGAFSTVASGGVDAFVTKLAANGASLLYSTFLGGQSVEAGYAVGIDTHGCAIVAGYTNSSDFPVTAEAVMTSYVGGGVPGDGFVVKVSANGSSVDFGTFIGGNGADQVQGITLDSAGVVYLVGTTTSTNLQSPSAAFSQPLGLDDGFFMKLNLGPRAQVDPLGPGCAPFGPVPTLGVPAPVLGSNVTTSGTLAPVGSLGELIASPVAPSMPLGNGCQVYLDSLRLISQGTFVVPGSGSWSMLRGVPSTPTMAGDRYTMQAVFLTPTSPWGFDLSAAVQLTLGF